MSRDEKIAIALLLLWLLLRARPKKQPAAPISGTIAPPASTPPIDQNSGTFEPGGGSFGGAGAGGDWNEPPATVSPPAPGSSPARAPAVTDLPNEFVAGFALVRNDDGRVLHPEFCNSNGPDYMLCPIEAFNP